MIFKRTKLPPRIPREVKARQPEAVPGMSPVHRKWVASLPCLLCPVPTRSDPHHLKHVHRELGGHRGGTVKNVDLWCIPLCRLHHDELHGCGNETSYLMRHGIIDGPIAALEFAERSPDEEIRKLAKEKWQWYRESPSAQRPLP
jgi:hypothetical protein